MIDGRRFDVDMENNREYITVEGQKFLIDGDKQYSVADDGSITVNGQKYTVNEDGKFVGADGTVRG